MRITHSLPLAAAILLAACGGGGDADADGDGTITVEEVAAEAEGMIQPRPGMYKTTMELIDLDIPGMTPEMQQQMRTMMGSEVTQGNDFCLTKEEAEKNGAQQMVQNFADSECTFDKFDVAGNTISTVMQCKDGESVNRIAMEGEMTGESSTMTMTADREIPGTGTAHMTMRVTSERTGECT